MVDNSAKSLLHTSTSNPDMMIIYAQELLMLSKSSLAEVLLNSSLPGRNSHNSPTGTAENHHRSK